MCKKEPERCHRHAVMSRLLDNNLQFNRARESSTARLGCEAAATSEAVLTEGACVQCRTKRNCSAPPPPKKITEPQVSIGNHAGKLISFVTYLLWRHQLRARQIKAEFQQARDSVSRRIEAASVRRDFFSGDVERVFLRSYTQTATSAVPAKSVRSCVAKI